MEKIISEEIPKSALKTLLEKGQLVWIKEDGNKIKEVIVGEIIKASLDRAWNVITDFKHHHEFIPGMQKSIVISKEEDVVVVKYSVGVKVMGIGGTIKYKTKYKLSKPKINILDLETGEDIGFIFLIPVEDNKRVMLFYGLKSKDIKSMHPFLGIFISMIPSVEVGFFIVPASMYVKALRKEIER